MRIYKAPVITRKIAQQTSQPAIANGGKLINNCVKISNGKENLPFNIKAESPQLTRTSESSSLRLLEKKQLAPPVKAYIYSPFCNKDMIIQAMAINVPRVLQGKEPYPILFSGSTLKLNRELESFFIQEKKGILLKGEVLAAKLQPFLNKNTIEQLHDMLPSETKKAGEFLALQKFAIVHIDKANTTKLEKIYVLGHGEAGSAKISDGVSRHANEKTVDHLTNELKGVINKSGKNLEIRLTACESADTKTALSMNKNLLAINAKSFSGKKPLAQHMSDSLQRQDVNAKVYGYHGVGISRGLGYFHQTRVLESELGSNKLSFHRSSQYRTEFKSTK